MLSAASYNSLMMQAGTLAEQLDEALAGVKGQLNVRNSRAKKSS